MKKNNITQVLAVAAAVLLLSSCGKDDTATVVAVKPAVGEYILSEGNFNSNNTKLSFYNNSNTTVTGDYFLQQNPTVTTGLGDNGNDMIIYGSKLYIVLNGSGRITVLKANDGTLIGNISFLLPNTTNKSPRYAVGARGKVYITSYNNTVSVIDTASLTIIKTITVGANPEGIAANNNFIYVANSGAFNTVPDSTVSVIDLNTDAEIRKIKVGVNPNKIEVNSAGDAFVTAYGNFTNIPASVSKIVGTAGVTTSTALSGYAYSHLRIFNDVAYFYNNYGGAGTAKLYNTVTNTVIRNEFITDGTVITTPYGININEENGDVYIADAKNYTISGTVTCFDKDGKKKFLFSVAPGVSPNKILFKR